MAQPRRSGRLIEQKQRESESAEDDGVIRWMKAPIEKDVDLEKVDMTWNSVCAAFPWCHADHAEEIVAFMEIDNVVHSRNHDIMRIAVCEANDAMRGLRAAREERASQFQEEMDQWIRQARLALFLAARKLKPRSTPWRQFTKTGDEGAYATTQKEIVERLERGILECFRDSNESVVSAELDALLSGCLCWGSLASVIDPQSIDAFAESFFDVLKPTGARVRCAAIAIRIFESIYTDAVTKNERDAKAAYPVERFEHYGCQMFDAEARRRVRVLPQFEWRGQIFRGAVWHRIETCSYGKWSVAEFDVDEIGDADAKGFAERAAAQAPPPRTSVFEKIAAFSERVGVAFERHQFVSACYESALNAHLRVFAPSVIAAMHCVEMDGSPIPEDELLNGVIIWNQSGQTSVIGHYAFSCASRGAAAPVVVATNDHFLIIDLEFCGSTLGKLMTASDLPEDRAVAGAVFKTLLTRIDPTRHRVDDTGLRENVFIGSRWTPAERAKHLPGILTRAIALLIVLGRAAHKPNDIKHRDIKNIEYLTSETIDAPERATRIDRFVTRFQSYLENTADTKTFWDPKIFTRMGVVDRLIAHDRRRQRGDDRKNADPPDHLTMWPLCYFIFFGQPSGEHGRHSETPTPGDSDLDEDEVGAGIVDLDENLKEEELDAELL